MRIIHFTPGTGNFYCGSCLRDHALAKGIQAQGHEMTIVPLYLPMVTDDLGEKEDADQPLFLGGINMYLQQKSALFRHAPKWIDRFFDRKSFLLKAAEKAGMTQAKDLGELTVSSFRGTHGRQTKEVEKLIGWLEDQSPKPDLISFSNGLLAGIAQSVQERLKIPVVCSLQGEDAFLESLPEPYKSESWELFRQSSQSISHYIAVSDYYRDVMQGFLKLEEDKIKTVHNGIDLTPFQSGPAPKELSIGYLARLCHGKGLHTLVDAFIELRQHSTLKPKLRLAGTFTSTDEDFLLDQENKLKKAGLRNEVEISKNLSTEEKSVFLSSNTVFSVPATYGEAFGLYVIESLVSGVPVVQPRHGGFPEILEKTQGGLLCQPDDPKDLANKLEQILSSPEKRQELAIQGEKKAREYFNADRMAADVLDLFDKIS